MTRCAHCRRGLERSSTGRPRRYCDARCKQAAFRKRQRRSVHFSSASCEWATPPEVFAELDREFHFTLDPCATAENAKCERFFTREQDGLAQEWTGRVFMNPPYGREIGAWMRKAWESAQSTTELVVCLIPSRTGSRWFQDYAMRGEVRYLSGRIRFGGASSTAPFDSAIAVFRNAQTVTKPALEEAA